MHRSSFYILSTFGRGKSIKGPVWGHLVSGMWSWRGKGEKLHRPSFPCTQDTSSLSNPDSPEGWEMAA